MLREGREHINTLLFVGGFIFDLIILPEAGHVATMWLGTVYLSIVAFAIAFREWIISRNTASKGEQRWYSFLTFCISYFSGSALSFISVYSIRSAAFAVSWPLIILLLVCALVNEFIGAHHFRLTLDIGVLLIATLFFVVFNLPVILKVQNDITFLISVVITIVISFVYVYVLRYMSESAEEETPRLFALACGIPMFLGMLYFLNVIPAVPLSLASGGVYHTVVKEESGAFYATKEEDIRMFAQLRVPVYHLTKNDTGVYFFSAVQAPALLTAPISHTWEWYNEDMKQWEEKTTVAFTLAGGRDDGYRAYSKKENVPTGLWRVTVKVDDKRIVGRMKFRVLKSEEEQVLLPISL